jgi:hypothetical protein
MSAKEVVERRRHRRFRAQDGVFAAPRVVNQERKLWHIMDISMGGLAFRYIPAADDFDKFWELDILTRDTLFSMEGVPLICISDLEMPDEPTTSYTLRRRSVRFGELTQSQTSKLEYLIRHRTFP